MTESLKIKGTLLFLYLGKLIEFGLIQEEQNNPILTAKGFDYAIDAYEKGERLTEEEIKELLKHTPGIDDDMRLKLFDLINHLQTVGFDEMKKQVEDFKQELNEKETGSV